jgi:hypothetical protein
LHPVFFAGPMTKERGLEKRRFISGGRASGADPVEDQKL